MSILGDYCCECGNRGAGPRQICETCLPLYEDEDEASNATRSIPPGSGTPEVVDKPGEGDL